MKHLPKILLFAFYIILSSNLSIPSFDNPSDRKIKINNAILAKVNGKIITVFDIKKKMDLLFHKSYPDLKDSIEARLQFYLASWKHLLTETIKNELILAEAESKEIKITDGEIRQEMEKQFGSNLISTLEQASLTYSQAWKMVKEEMIIQRMRWFYITSKALQKVTPQVIKQEYRLYCVKNPPLEKWTYQLISIRYNDGTINAQIAERAHQILTNKEIDQATPLLRTLEKEYSGASIQISKDIEATSKTLSKEHKAVLSSLKENSLSLPIAQISRKSNIPVYRIFYLKTYQKDEPPSFENLYNKLKEELLQQEVLKKDNLYFEKLLKYYNISSEKLIPEEFQPFDLE